MPETGEAGRDFDMEIAERVMGWPRVGMDTGLWMLSKRTRGFILPEGPQVFVVGIASNPWCPSTDMADAWQVVEKMRDHPEVRLRNVTLTAYCYNRTYATFDSAHLFDYTPEHWAEGNGEHATPLAICRAALKAIGSVTLSDRGEPSA